MDGEKANSSNAINPIFLPKNSDPNLNIRYPRIAVAIDGISLAFGKASDEVYSNMNIIAEIKMAIRFKAFSDII